MIRNYPYIFLMLLIEGASLMATEIIGAKLLSPFFGSSLYVWTAVLMITVLGLTIGYFTGGEMARRGNSLQQPVIIIGIAAALVIAMPWSGPIIISITKGLPLLPGICLASMLLLVPPMFLFGLIGPLAVSYLSFHTKNRGDVAGTVYFVSTSGGILATFLFGFFLIPETGLKLSSILTGLALALLPAAYAGWYLFSARSHSSIDEKTTVTVPPKKPDVAKKKEKISTNVRTKRGVIYLFAAIEGASVMAVELLSARMLAPWFGSSLYVWCTVIGFTLTGLALGYFFGGRLAEKHQDVKMIFWVILIAAVLLSFMHLTSAGLTQMLQGAGIRFGAVMVSTLLILPPLVCLGMIPTMIIRYVTDKLDNAGRTTGRVFTLSSASGILALPIIGFWIIPSYGLTSPSLVIGLLVGIVPLGALIRQKKFLAFLFPILFILSFSARTRSQSSPEVDVKYYSEGLLGQVMVADVTRKGAGNQTIERILFVNRMGQTAVDKNTMVTRWNYITFAGSAASRLPEDSKVLLLGLGGGSVAGMLWNLKMKVHAIELDSRIAGVARSYFALPLEVQVTVDDARHYIETTGSKYDLVFFDVFKGETMPAHVLTLECFTQVKKLLNSGGMIIINFNGFLSGKPGRPGRSVYATLKAAGFDVKILPTPGPENERNSIFLATSVQADYANLRSPLLFNGEPVNMDTLFLDPAKLEPSGNIIFRDDRPILDRLSLEGAETWRKGYNGSYTKFMLGTGVPLFK